MKIKVVECNGRFYIVRISWLGSWSWWDESFRGGFWWEGSSSYPDYNATRYYSYGEAKRSYKLRKMPIITDHGEIK
jgi:hypothetical protein